MQDKRKAKNFYWYILYEMKAGYNQAETEEEKSYYIGIIQTIKIFAELFDNVILPEWNKILFTSKYNDFMDSMKDSCSKCEKTCIVNNFRLVTAECFTSQGTK